MSVKAQHERDVISAPSICMDSIEDCDPVCKIPYVQIRKSDSVTGPVAEAFVSKLREEEQQAASGTRSAHICTS